MDYLKRKTLVLKAKNLTILETALSIGKYKECADLFIEGFAVSGILRKRYYVILTGTPCNLEYIYQFARVHKNLECYSSNPLPNQHFDHKKKEWVMSKENRIKYMSTT